MSFDFRTRETEIATLVNQAKVLYAELEAKGGGTGEDRQRLDRLVSDGVAKRAQLDNLKKLGEIDGGGAGERLVKEPYPAGVFGNKSWGHQVIESAAFKTNNRREMEAVQVGEIKALYGGTSTQGGAAVANDLRPEILDIARQRPPSIIDLVGRGQTSSDNVDYVLMDTRNGGVVSVTMTAQGSGYVSGTAVVTFGNPPAGGVLATGTPTVVAGAITGVTITNPGSGYVSAPSVTFSVTGTGATGTAVLGGPAVVGEYASGQFGLKPEAGMTLDLKSTPVKTIATWVAASRQILDDAPRLRSTIDNELQYMIRVELENQILTGSGTGQNFTGILNTSGIQSRVHAVSGRGFVSTDKLPDTLRRAITDLYLAFYEPDGIVLNPADVEILELLKATTNQYLAVFDSAIMRVWRVPVISTAAITAGTGLVANFGLGTTLWDRMQSEVRVGEPNDMFLRNAVAILAELRAAWGVVRPQAVEKVTGIVA